MGKGSAHRGSSHGIADGLILVRRLDFLKDWLWSENIVPQFRWHRSSERQ
jgi:hypothetical protein